MATFALAPSKNAGEPRNRPWAFVSAAFDETPTRKIYEMSAESS
jgi:hypothetical protein